MAPNGQADGTIDELRKALYQESEGRARSRGIIEEDPELQTFEIYIPIELRRIYDNFMQSFDEVKQNPAKLSQEVKKWAYDSGVQANI